jgi:hypothetical protein
MARARSQVYLAMDRSILSEHSPLNPTPTLGLKALGAGEKAHTMSQLSKVTRSRNQWKEKATQRSDHHRYLRKQLVRVKAERDQAKQALKATQIRLRQIESQGQTVAMRPKADVVF